MGLFEGGGYYAKGVFRPELTCKMRQQTDSFCAVCRRRIEQQMMSFGGTSVIRTVPVPFVVVTAQIGGKFILPGTEGGYNVNFAVNTNLPAPVSYRCSIDASVLHVEPTWPAVPVAMNLAAADPYTHSATVEATVGLDQLEYWVPDDPAFTSATQKDIPFVFPRPSNSGGSIVARYDNPQSVVEGDSVTVGLKPDLRGGADSQIVSG